MKVFLIDKDKVLKYMLPNRVDDSYIINYTLDNSRECAITFEGHDNKWYLKSNGTVSIVGENESELVELVPYQKYILRLVESQVNVDFLCLPTKEVLFKLSFNNLNNISIGSNSKCNIFYDNILIADVEAVIKKVGDDWIIAGVNDERYKVFINNRRINAEKLKTGDIIFIDGLKIVWMNTFIYINNPNNVLKIAGMEMIEDSYSFEEILPVSDEDRYVNLYNKDDYFVHYPTIRESLEEKEVVVDSPPNEEKPDNRPFILTMGSSLVMGASSFYMGWNVFTGISSGKDIGSMIPQIVMCVSMVLGSIIMPKIASSYQKKMIKEKEALRREKYGEYLTGKERELQIAIKNQLQILNTNYPSPSDCLVAIEKKNRNFWWRQFKDQEFLCIRLGLGRIDSKISIKAPEEHFSLDEDDVLSETFKIKPRYDSIDGAPIMVSLREYPVTCVVSNNLDYINGLIIQLITLHSSMDLNIALFINDKSSSLWDFMKYVPHVFSSDKSVRYYATDENEAKYVSNNLVEILNSRKEQKGENENSGNISYEPYYLIITDDYKNYSNIPIIDEVVNRDGRNFGFSILIIDESMKQVPSNGNAFVELGAKDGVAIEVKDGVNTQKVFYLEKQLQNVDMRSVAINLANVPVMSKEGDSVLPTSLKFLDMFNVSKIEQLNIVNRWQVNNPVLSLDTVVGVHASGDKFKLDLHEKFHGPHGLIAGSTGSGKSEFIITYILSLAINYHPYEVQFVLIDYKGGGLAGAFLNKETGVKIPHLVGTITNLDNSSLNRSLVSIQSELRRRQKVFNDVREALGEGTIDIYKYQKLYREGVVKSPMSHLFIISDEFAELKQQQPEFMGQLISISRIGRSLGVHLILATQKPSGVVNDQIWANSKFKVCLKVQDKSDSMEMLKRPEAASIKETGRFYLQVGYDELFELGQSGWSGAKYVPSDEIKIPVDESINYINNVGFMVKSVKDEEENLDSNVSYGDQLTNLVRYIYEIGKKEELVTRNLWLDAIPEVIYVDDLMKKYNYMPKPYYINPLIGEYDDPENQYQQLLTVDLSNRGNLLVFGIPGSGKENLLTTMIRSLVTEHTPEEVNIYIVDCGAESLKVFNGFPHVGGVVTVDEKERIKDLLDMLREEIEVRKEKFVEYAGSYNDYIANSNEKLPFIVVVFNNFDVFSENYQDEANMAQNLFRDGAKYGVTFVVSVINNSSIRSKTMSYFTNRISLKLANDMDYRMTLEVKSNVVPADYFGRGVVVIGDGVYEFQTASFASKNEFTNHLRDLKKTLNVTYQVRAKLIPSIPDKVLADSLLSQVVDAKSIPVGYDYKTRKIAYMNFGGKDITPIVFNSFDEEKVSFISGLNLLMKSKLPVIILDFGNYLDGNNSYGSVINSEFDDFINDITGRIVMFGGVDNESYLVITGYGKAKDKLNDENMRAFEDMLSNESLREKMHIILVEDANEFRDLKMELWFRGNVSLDNAIWLGSGYDSQSVFTSPSLNYEDRKISYNYMGYIINKDKLIFIKHIIDEGEVL